MDIVMSSMEDMDSSSSTSEHVNSNNNNNSHSYNNQVMFINNTGKYFEVIRICFYPFACINNIINLKALVISFKQLLFQLII